MIKQWACLICSPCHFVSLLYTTKWRRPRKFHSLEPMESGPGLIPRILEIAVAFTATVHWLWPTTCMVMRLPQKRIEVSVNMWCLRVGLPLYGGKILSTKLRPHVVEFSLSAAWTNCQLVLQRVPANLCIYWVSSHYCRWSSAAAAWPAIDVLTCRSCCSRNTGNLRSIVSV